MVRPDSELPALQHVTEVGDGQVDSKEFPVEGTIFPLRRRQFLRKERDWWATGIMVGQDLSLIHI